MFISDDDVLYCKNKEQNQVVLPHALKETVYRELHINMVHLVADKTLQLIRKSFYWPKMEEEVRHFINVHVHQCPCVRQKKPHIEGNAPLLAITSSASLEVVRINFLHLEKLLRIHNLRTTPYQPETNSLTERMNQTPSEPSQRNITHCEKTMSIKSFMLITA